MPEYQRSGSDPANEPAQRTNPRAQETLTRMIQSEVASLAGDIQDQVMSDVDAKIAAHGDRLGRQIANELNKVSWAQDPDKVKALEKLLGLEDALRVMATSDFADESMPEHLRTLNDRVGGLETLIQEAEARRPQASMDVLDPRAQAIEMYEDRLNEEPRLRAAFAADPRLSHDYQAMLDRFVRKGERSLSPEQRKLFAQGATFVTKFLDNPSYEGAFEQDVQNALLAPDFDPGGGAFVAPTVEQRIREKLVEFSPVLGLARREPVSSDTYEWMQETGALPTSSTPSPHGAGGTENTNVELWKKREAKIFTLVSEIPLVRNQLADTARDLFGLLTNMVARQFGKDASRWAITGSGGDEPLGLAQDSNVTAVNSGVADSVALHSFLFLMTQLPGFYESRAEFVLGDDAYTAAVIELDNDNRPKWNPSTAEGLPPNLYGHRVSRDTYFTSATTVTSKKVTFASNAIVAAFAAWEDFVVIPERSGVFFLRTESAKPGESQQIDVAFSMRQGFAVDLREAGRTMKVAA